MHNRCGGFSAACFLLVLLASVGRAFCILPVHQLNSRAASAAQACLASRAPNSNEIVTGNGDIVNLKTMSESSAVRVGCGGGIGPEYVAAAGSGLVTGVGSFFSFIVGAIAF